MREITSEMYARRVRASDAAHAALSKLLEHYPQSRRGNAQALEVLLHGVGGRKEREVLRAALDAWLPDDLNAADENRQSAEAWSRALASAESA